MTPAEHYAEADRLLAEVEGRAETDLDAAMILLGRAEVHAALARATPAVAAAGRRSALEAES